MSDKKLRRYTNMNSLIYLLKKKALTLVDPSSWIDTNDSFGLSEYKKRKSLNTLLVLCFAYEFEKYHHWHLFAQGTSGVCITFLRDDLLEDIKSNGNIRYKDVNYLTIEDYENQIGHININKLPFIKRRGFIEENEFRIIYENKTNIHETIDIPIHFTTIDHIAFNPWIPKTLFDSTVELIRSIEGVGDITITRSTLLDNKKWKKLVRQIR